MRGTTAAGRRPELCHGDRARIRLAELEAARHGTLRRSSGSAMVRGGGRRGPPLPPTPGSGGGGTRGCAGRTPIPTAVQGLKEPKAKAVPDMVSVLSTAASEDVAHLLGGVDLALSSLHASSRRIPVLVLVQDCFKLWSSSWIEWVSSILRLCFVDALSAFC